MVEVAVKGGLKEYEETDGKSWEEEMARDERLKDLKSDDTPEANGNGEEEKDSCMKARWRW